MPTVESLLNVPDVSRLGRWSIRQTWKLIAAQQICTPIRVGRAVRFRASDVDLWFRLGCPDRATFDAAKTAGKAGAA
jgi:predicted DNA-binding transcriptional regulator AlpA